MTFTHHYDDSSAWLEVPMETVFAEASDPLGSEEHECFQQALDIFLNENP